MSLMISWVDVWSPWYWNQDLLALKSPFPGTIHNFFLCDCWVVGWEASFCLHSWSSVAGESLGTHIKTSCIRDSLISKASEARCRQTALCILSMIETFILAVLSMFTPIVLVSCTCLYMCDYSYTGEGESEFLGVRNRHIEKNLWGPDVQRTWKQEVCVSTTQWRKLGGQTSACSQQFTLGSPTFSCEGFT